MIETRRPAGSKVATRRATGDAASNSRGSQRSTRTRDDARPRTTPTAQQRPASPSRSLESSRRRILRRFEGDFGRDARFGSDSSPRRRARRMPAPDDGRARRRQLDRGPLAPGDAEAGTQDRLTIGGRPRRSRRCGRRPRSLLRERASPSRPAAAGASGAHRRRCDSRPPWWPGDERDRPTPPSAVYAARRGERADRHRIHAALVR